MYSWFRDRSLARHERPWRLVYKQLPDPKVVVAMAVARPAGNVFCGSPTIEGPLDRIICIDIVRSGLSATAHGYCRGYRGCNSQAGQSAFSGVRRTKDEPGTGVSCAAIFPGLLYAVPMGRLMLGTERKCGPGFKEESGLR